MIPQAQEGITPHRPPELQLEEPLEMGPILPVPPIDLSQGIDLIPPLGQEGWGKLGSKDLAPVEVGLILARDPIGQGVIK